jgi:hypothetical protein
MNAVAKQLEPPSFHPRHVRGRPARWCSSRGFVSIRLGKRHSTDPVDRADARGTVDEI